MVMPRDDEAHSVTTNCLARHWETIYWTVPENWRAMREDSLETRRPLLQQLPMSTMAALSWRSMPMKKNWWCHRWIWFVLKHLATLVRAARQYLMVDRHSRATLAMKAEANSILTGRTGSNSPSPDIVINPLDDWARDSLNYDEKNAL